MHCKALPISTTILTKQYELSSRCILGYYPQVLLFEKGIIRKYCHNKSSKTIYVYIGAWKTLYALSSPANFLRTVSSIPLLDQLSCYMSF